ncbi:RNA-binding Raly-like protein [Eulemur rufifrons]|uniref:RNA-binding Raly-like protein n=1 Tax=Eulemur rufifrons TaxID=859984 RepID=UPI003743A4B5
MAQEPTPSPARPGQKRQQGTAIFCSNYDLNYELYREDAPYRVHEYQRIPPLINRVPVKLRRTHMGLGVKSSFSPHKASRNSPLPPAQIKLRTEELRSIRGELSQIKAQVDSLLQHVERMDQQRDQPAGTKDSEENRGSGSEGSSNRRSEPWQKPKGQRANPEADSSKGSTDTEQPVKNSASDQEGSQ